MEIHLDWSPSLSQTPCITWYQILGTLHSQSTPLIIIHGGPGMSHDYLKSLTPLPTLTNQPLIFYDQIGNGRSTRYPDSPKEFWTTELFILELRALVSHLNISQYDILGHSWGGQIAAQFATQKPRGLRKLVLANTMVSTAAWLANYARYRKELPEELQRSLNEADPKSEEFKRAMEVFYERHWVLKKFRGEVMPSLRYAIEDGTVLQAMKGGSHWVVKGVMDDWNIEAALAEIVAETLVIEGTAEGSSGEASAPFLRKIKNVRGVIFEDSRHMPHLEEREKFLGVVAEFLT